jgi:hypothetical protein
MLRSTFGDGSIGDFHGTLVIARFPTIRTGSGTMSNRIVSAADDDSL